MSSGTAATAMLSPYVLGELRSGPATTAALSAAAAVSTILLTLTAVPHRADRELQLRVMALHDPDRRPAAVPVQPQPGLPLVLLPLAGAGALAVSSYPASALVGPLLPDDIRTSAFSLLMGLLAAAQALGTAAIGGLADLVGTAPAITLSALPDVIAGLFYPQQVLSDYGCRPADNSAAPSRRAPGQTSRTPARSFDLRDVLVGEIVPCSAQSRLVAGTRAVAPT